MIDNSQVKGKIYIMNKKRLLESRKAQGLTQRELGEKIGLDTVETARTTISRYERGVKEPNSSVVRKLADALDVPLFYLYIEEDVFAKKALSLYRKGNSRYTQAEIDLISAKNKISQYEDAINSMQRIISSLKKEE
ncbi:helix-turn-helix domain-containing protein (plasmid) [Xenorhabdus stockiae]|uniref:helix-turn-helix domain-containing protein n=1 Tax=Xenorhabdus stockiae TaxID=351614 RepID=UPI003CF69A3C